MKNLFLTILLSIIFLSSSIAQTSPEKPEQPYGISSLCNINANTTYTINVVTSAESYIWSFIPEEAGTIETKDTAVIINFSEEYSGVAKLSVIARNTQGDSPSSDTLTINIEKLPDQPETPIGDSIICFGTAELDFYIHSVDDALDYVWTINPLNSSRITSGDSLATLIIYDDYIGKIDIIVEIGNNCGRGIGSIPKTVEIIQPPLAPAIPKGDKSFCLNDSVHKFYTTGTTFASSYEWKIEPENAAQLEITNDTIYANWDANFRKNFQIFVMAKNKCGSSEYSQSFEGYLNIIPASPTTVSGDMDICQGTDYNVFTIDSVDEATNYEWFIYPDTAAEMAGITRSGNAYWNENHYGYAYIFANASNFCGISGYSDSIEVSSLSQPKKMDIPTGVEQMCINAENLLYESNASENSKWYDWIVVPNNAGTISSDSLIGIMNWENNYLGTVKIAVRGVNECGKGPSSDSILIEIKEQLHAQFSYVLIDLNVAFTNGSFPELTENKYFWNFGDNSNSQSISPSHTYPSNGTYDISFIISNPFCISDTSIQTIQLGANAIESLGIAFDENFDAFPIPATNNITISIKKPQNEEFKLKIIDIRGNIHTQKNINFSSSAYNLDVNSLKNGIYYLVLQTEKSTFVKKIIIN
ncbi:MAG: T9SS type A sorting domain-containing protein [Bacteroidales bacterium]|nr:T9SS type A sorting domain-containing protein [Bacteroidales bacterium]